MAAASMGRYGFAPVARMEWTKARSLRSTWWLLAASTLAMIAVGAGVGIGYRTHTPVATTAQIVNNSLGGAVLAQLLLGAVGVLVVTGEYSAGTMRSTLSAIPRRRLVLTAKAAVYAVVALAVGVVDSLAGYLAGQAAVAGTPIARACLADGPVLRAVLLTGVYLGVVGVLGVGLGAMIRHTGGAIGALFGGLFVPMILAGMVGPAGIAVSRFVPMMLLVNSVAVTSPVPGMLSAAAGVAVMLLYAAFALVGGAAVLIRRDA